MNNVGLVGRLTRDPELTYTPAGVAVVRFTLAIDRDFTGANGEREADFVSVIAWRQLAETCANYLRKGRLTSVTGRITTGSYVNNEGKKVYTTDVTADKVKFLESQNARSNNSERNGQDPFSGEGKPVDIPDDDLPF